MRRAGRWSGWTALLAAALIVSACSGVPSSSVPQVVRTGEGLSAGTTGAAIGPKAGASQREIVSGFLAACVTNDAQHSAARQFLTRAAATGWKDSTVTVVNSLRVGNVDRRGVVPVSGREVGHLDNDGNYNPVLQGDGTGGDLTHYDFRVAWIDGQYRISSPHQGLLIALDDFQRSFQGRPLYFFDQAEKTLVPDLRYSAATGQSLATWLLKALLAGPQNQLKAATKSEVPDQVVTDRATATAGNPFTVQLPGLSQVDPATVDRVAAEIAFTFASVAPGTDIRILDGVGSVAVKGAETFTSRDFPELDPGPTGAPPVYYLKDGGVYAEQGTPLTGPVGRGHYGLFAVAVSAGGAASGVQLAGLADLGAPHLLVGSQRAGLVPRPLPGQALSRPEWTRDGSEVWIGVGTSIYRVGRSGAARQVPVDVSGGDPGQRRVLALRFSPEGARIALVLQDSSGRAAGVWVGAVVRDGSQVRVDSLHPITPPDWVVLDVAWSGLDSVEMVGTNSGDQSFGIWSAQVDGSKAEVQGTRNLPDAPKTITSTPEGTTWVAVGNTLWRDNGAAWVSPASSGDTLTGTAPIYRS